MKNAWRPIFPIPDDAHPAPTRHPRHGEPSGSWAYRDAAGRLLGFVWRFDLIGGGKEFAPLTFCENAATGTRAWRFKNWPAPRPLYGLDQLAQRPGAPVVICEGEKSADAAGAFLPDYVAIASPGGASAAKHSGWMPVAGRKVIISPDHDGPG
jgi:hypothetical protein